MKKSLIRDQAEHCSSIGLEMAAKNMEEGHASLIEIRDFGIYRLLLRLMFMSMSFLMGNFYQSNNKTSSNLLHRNSLEFVPRATVKQEKLNI